MLDVEKCMGRSWRLRRRGIEGRLPKIGSNSGKARRCSSLIKKNGAHIMTSKRLTDRARFHGISRSLAADGSTKLDAVLYRRDAETLASRKRIKLVFPRTFPAQVERSREESSAKSRLSNQINRRLCLTVDRGFEIESNLSLPLSWWIVMPTPRLVSRHIRRIDLIRQSSPANGWRGNWLNHPNPWRIGDAAQYSIETRSRSRAETCSNQPKRGFNVDRFS